MTDLEGKIVLVVGASGVLGGLIAERLAAAGATVIASGRDHDRLEGPHLAGPKIVADLFEDPAEIVRAAERYRGRLDGVVIAAGIVAFGPVRDLETSTIHDLFTANARSPQSVRSRSL